MQEAPGYIVFLGENYPLSVDGRNISIEHGSVGDSDVSGADTPDDESDGREILGFGDRLHYGRGTGLGRDVVRKAGKGDVGRG